MYCRKDLSQIIQMNNFCSTCSNFVVKTLYSIFMNPPSKSFSTAIQYLIFNIIPLPMCPELLPTSKADID